MTIPMAIVDYIPVFLFAAAAILLQRELYHKMSKGAFALFAAGTVMIFIAGFYKATWKLLYAANICDFEALSQTFFPMQATGFLLAGLGVVALLCHKQGTTLYSVGVAPVLYDSKMIFVVVMILGTTALCGGLTVLSKRKKSIFAMICFIIAFFGMLSMGYLSSKDFSGAFMNWVAQGVNILGQGAMLAGALLLQKAGAKQKQVQ